MKIDNKPIERFDWSLAFILLLFCIISLFAIASAQTTGQYGESNFVPSQIQWYVVGSIIIAMTMYLEPEQYKKAAWIIYGGGIFLLGLLEFLPGSLKFVEERNHAKSWFHIPGVGSIQPAEFMKTFFIIGLARLITKHHEKYLEKTMKTDFYLLGKIVLITNRATCSHFKTAGLRNGTRVHSNHCSCSNCRWYFMANYCTDIFRHFRDWWRTALDGCICSRFSRPDI